MTNGSEPTSGSAGVARVIASGAGAVAVARDAVGNTILTGSGNVVVIHQVQSLLQPEPPAPGPIGPNPYKGLEAFNEADADRFFGREALIGELWQRFADLHTAPTNAADRPLRLLPVLGPSGCGKSSLVRAGLVPELARRPLPALQSPRVAILTPGAHPLEALATVLARVATGDKVPVAKTREFAGELALKAADGSVDGLRRIADALPDINQSPLVVLVDQFEEAYALCDDAGERDAFIATLLDAAADRGGRVSIILTMRTDFLGATIRHPALNQLLSARGIIVPAMSEDELRRAIAEPARLAGHAFDEATVELLVKETIGREGALPLLQFTLTRIWEGLARGVEPAETYRAIGGVGGALAQEADRLLAELEQRGEAAIAKRAFLAMVRLGEGTQDTRRRARLDEIVASGEDPATVRAVLERFARPGERLVSLGAEGDAITVEVTHEQLISRWPTLRDWLETDRGDLRFRRRLGETVRAWEKGEAALWRGADLSRLETFAQGHLREMNEAETRFLTRSRWRRRRARGAVAAAVLILIVASVGFGAWQQQSAEREAGLRTTAEAAQASEAAAREAAESEAARAEVAAEEARANAMEAQRNQSLMLAGLARQQARLEPTERDVDPTRAVLLALEALPIGAGVTELEDTAAAAADRPLVPGAVKTFMEAVPRQHQRLVLAGHDGAVRAASFDRDGGRVVTGSGDGTARIWDAATGAKLRVLEGHADLVQAASFDRDGGRVVTGSFDGTARIWDVATGAELRVLEGHSDFVQAASFDRDGGRVVTGSDDGTARIWDVATGAEVRVLEGHSDFVRSASFDRDGGRVVTGSDDGTARIWDAATGAELRVLQGHSGWVLAASFDRDGRRVVTGSYDGTARIWDAATGAELQVLEGHDDFVWAASFDRDGGRVVTGSGDGLAGIWDVATGGVLRVLEGHSGWWVRAASFDRDGVRVVTGSDDGTARIWDAETGAELKVLEGHSSLVWSTSFDSAGGRVMTGSIDDTARIWDAETGELLRVLEGHTNSVQAAVFDPFGGRVATGSADGTARIWDPETGEALRVLEGHNVPLRVLEGHNEPVWVVVFDSVGERVLTGSHDGTARIWDAATGAELRVLYGHAESVRSASFDRDGGRALTGSADGTARIWDAATGAELRVLEGHTDAVRAVIFDADGGRALTGSGDATARIWDSATGAELRVLEGHNSAVNAASFDRDGGRVVTGSDDGTARIWDAETGELLRILEGHTDYVQAASFDRDGGRLVTGSFDGTARIWDAETGTELQVLKGHTDRVWAAVFDLEGGRVVTGSSDHTARIWDAGIPGWPDAIDFVCARLPRDLSTAERRRFFLPVDESEPETDGFLKPGERPRWCERRAALLASMKAE